MASGVDKMTTLNDKGLHRQPRLLDLAIKVKEAMKKNKLDKYIAHVYIYEDAFEIRFELKKDVKKNE